MNKTDKTLNSIYGQLNETVDESQMWDIIEKTIERFNLDRIQAAAVRAEFN